MLFQTLQCQKKAVSFICSAIEHCFSLSLSFWCAGTEQSLPLIFSASHGRSLSFSPWELLYLTELWGSAVVWHSLPVAFHKVIYVFLSMGICCQGNFFTRVSFFYSSIIAQFSSCGKMYLVDSYLNCQFLENLSCIELNPSDTSLCLLYRCTHTLLSALLVLNFVLYKHVTKGIHVDLNYY